jgi:pentose-5-phosphate-3-epimerase
MCGNNAPHADVFDDVRKGVSLDLITEMANTGTGLIDVHLLAEGALSAAFDVVCRPGVSGITFPYEGVDDVEAVAGRIRAVGAQRSHPPRRSSDAEPVSVTSTAS